MFAKAKRHDCGADLADYFLRQVEGERVEVLEVRGGASEELIAAFQSVDAIAMGTRCTKPMLHVSVRNPEGENLTREQWLEVADGIEKKLRLEGQLRGIVMHIDEATGEAHIHIGWSLIDADTLTARQLPFFVMRLSELCREYEQKFGLRVLNDIRQKKVMAPTRNEEEQAYRLGNDANQVHETIRDCWDRSDNGRSFQVALEYEGLLLARGDRRDLVVVDECGGVCALGKRVLGISVAEMRERCKDIDRDSLPTVEQGRTEQRSVKRDQHAADLAWEDALAAAGIEKEQQARRFDEPHSQELCEELAPAILDELTKKRSTFTRRDIENALKDDVPDRWERKAMAETMLRRPEIVRLDAPDQKNDRYSTELVVQGEDHVSRAALVLANTCTHKIDQSLVAQRGFGLPDEKGRALAHICSREGLSILDGQAGTGKSTVLAAAREIHEAAGYRVVALAPTNQVVEDLRKKGFEYAATADKELGNLAKGRTQWTSKTAIMIDEAAMLDTRRLAMVLAHAAARGSKVVLAGDDRQLSSIDRAGMFEVLKQRHGSTVLTKVFRQNESDERSASELMAAGKFQAALNIYEAKKSIHWHKQASDAADALVKTYMEDHAKAPEKTRFIFAYTNAEVSQINAVVREARQARGELGEDHSFETKYGPKSFAVNDRIQFTATDHWQRIVNGHAGTVRSIEGNEITVKLDGHAGPDLKFNASRFQAFRHGYAGTIYQGQGRTIEQTYLLHSEYWRRSSSYVALTRHSDKAELFVAREVAPNLRELSRQMSRLDERRAASFFAKDHTVSQDKPTSPDRLGHWYENLKKYSLYLQSERQQAKRRRDEDGDRDSTVPREVRVGMAGNGADQKVDGVRTLFTKIAQEHADRKNEAWSYSTGALERSHRRLRLGRDGRQR